ncbi:MAG: hypothetical protein BMS9Abin02_1646 [Anaerolineae bacterium]|nr:MAG: hypothetical protein BMS9Abin02_1646 [Anaerolineae bacterium]
MEINHLSRENDIKAPIRRFDGFALVGLAILILLAFQAAVTGLRSPSKAPPEPISAAFESSEIRDSHARYPRFRSQSPRPLSAAPAAAIIYPYDSFILTQGPHGGSYGHMAIDLAAGAGTEIKSPIAGKIAALFKDEIGNPTLVIENEIYQVTLLHGLYSVYIGQEVEQGQVIGKESNAGNTTDMLGRSCLGRECGYHTHLNIFDKRIGANVNPLAVLGK